MSRPVAATQLAGRTRDRLIGRAEEVDQLVAAIAAGCDVVLEGPPGTSKTTLLRAVADAAALPCFLAEGSAFLTPARLVGRHDPAAVLAHGYRPEDFVPGPLVEAMQAGGLLALEEVNRVPEDTLNLLLGPLAERTIRIPRVGTIVAAPGFRVLATMNPSDNAGTVKLSRSIRDRVLLMRVGYQPLADETQIVVNQAGDAPAWLSEAAATISHATRVHPDVARGASVRGAIDLALIAPHLGQLRATPLDRPSAAACEVVLDAALLSFSGRIELDPACTRTVEAVIAEVVLDVLQLNSNVARGDHQLTIDNAVQFARPPAPRPGPRPQTHGAAQSRPKREAAWPRPGRANTPPRVYGADELAVLLTSRSGAAGPLGVPPALGSGGHLEDQAESPADTLDLAAADGVRPTVAPTADRRGQADPLLRAHARRIANRMVVRMARRIPSKRAGAGKLNSVRYHHDSDDLDLDRTVEEIAGKPYPEPDDIWVVERVRARRAYALLLDVSGSMRGEQLEIAATATAAVAAGVHEDELAVVAFWRDAAVLKRVDQDRDVEGLVTDILSLRARGLTNLRLGLETGLRQLARSRTPDRVAILLSDGGHNLGGDPLEVAYRFAPLHVIATSPDDTRMDACRELAERGGGHAALVSSTEDVAAAVSQCLVG